MIDIVENKRQHANIKQLSLYSLLEDVHNNIGIYTIAITLMSFVLKSVWYIYQRGFFCAIKLDTYYLKANSENGLYNVILFFGIGTVFCAINYWMFFLITQKNYRLIVGTILFEMLVLTLVVCVQTNINIVILVMSIESWNQVKDLLLSLFFCIYVFNIYAISFILSYFFVNRCKDYANNKEKTNNEENHETNTNNQNQKNYYLMIIATILVATSLLGVITYYFGMVRANQKVNYRIIVEEKPKSEVDLDTKYIFPSDKKDIVEKYYAVLFETDENFILTPLYMDGNRLQKDVRIQKVVSKENQITYYCENIEKAVPKEKNK